MPEPSPLMSLPVDRSERWTLLDSLIARWHPAAAEPSGFTPGELRLMEASRGFPIPTALAEWYESSGKRRSVWSRQDEFLPADKLYLHNDALIFYVENQGVVRWGIPTADLVADDPPVVVESVDNADQWIPQATNLSKFAIYMFAYTLAFAEGDSWVYGYAKPTLAQLIPNRFPAFEFPDTWWTETRLFGYDDLVVAIDGTDHVHACAASIASLAAFTERFLGSVQASSETR